MHFPVQPQRLVANAFQLLHGAGFGNPDLRGQVAYTIDGAKPHDVLNVNVIANESLRVVVNVDYADKSVSVLPEEVKKR